MTAVIVVSMSSTRKVIGVSVGVSVNVLHSWRVGGRVGVVLISSDIGKVGTAEVGSARETSEYVAVSHFVGV